MTYQTPFILTDAGRMADIMKQGFMKPLPVARIRKDGKRFGTKPGIVACNACENWHTEGKHTLLDAVARRANVKKYRASDKAAAARRAQFACETTEWN